MNDFSELETELKQLRAAQPSADLFTRVECALNEVANVSTAGVLPRRSRPKLNWFVLGFGLAAAAAFFMLARLNVDRASQSKATRIASAPTPQAPAFVSDGVTRVVYHTADDGLIYPANFNEPARRLRSRSRETLAFRDTKSGASLRVSYPTEEVELVPVSLSVQ